MEKNGLGKERGAAMVTALIFMVALGALMAAYSMNVQATINLRGTNGVRRSAFYAAEAGLNVGITRFSNIFQGGGVPQGLDFQQSLSFSGKSVAVDLSEVAGCSPCPPTQIPEGEVFAGLSTIPYRYTVQSVSTVPPGNSTAHVAGEFDIHNIPIFQFLAFIDSHLFVMPLPNMSLHGRLHTNSDLFIQPDNTLTVEDLPPTIQNVQVTAAGNIHRGGRKYDANWYCRGSASIDMLADNVSPFDDLDPKTMNCGSEGPLSDSLLSGWNGSIKSNVRNIVTPEVGIINKGSGEYWKRADLRIVLNLSAGKSAIDFGAADLCPGGTPPLTSPALPHIEVHDATGGINVAKTRHLWRFMCEHRGALFFNDLPINPPVPAAGNAAAVSDLNDYNPNFTSIDTVYRRVGEDTSGNGTITATDSNLAICPSGPAAQAWWRPIYCPALTAPLPLSSWYRDMDYRRGGFWNQREQQWMYLLNVNVRALIEWNEFSGDPLFPHGDTSDGGLVLFLTVEGPNSNAANNNYGARIFDSADLDNRNVTFPPGAADPTGITVVSDQAIIIQGNLNKVDKYPVAVLADAIWILSQGWETPIAAEPNDRKSIWDLSTGRRDVPANDTPGTGSFSSSTALTINAAMLFGLGPSTRNPDWYNGGLENFPNFLESWTNRTMNYRGSFVSLGEPQHKRSDWACGSGTGCLAGVYDPPVRAYDYDSDFNDVANLPPMTPKVVFVQQRIYTRVYD